MTIPGNPCRNGFTLIEILVVVVIISIVASMALLSINPGHGRESREEAERLAALIKLAGQEAIVGSRELALEVAKDGYRFLEYRDQQWTAFDDNILRPREMPDHVRLETYIYGGMASENENHDDTLPRIFILSSGELTPFKIVVRSDENESLYQVTGEAGGKVMLAEQ